MSKVGGKIVSGGKVNCPSHLKDAVKRSISDKVVNVLSTYPGT